MNLNLRFSATPAKSETGLPTKFFGVAYRGDVIENYGNFGSVVIDLANIKFGRNGQVICFAHHDPKLRIGMASLTVINNEIRVTGEFYDTVSAIEVRQEFAKNIPWELSVGLLGSIERNTQTIALNGRQVKPDHILRNCSVRELSFVSLGADPTTEVYAFSAYSTHCERERIARIEQFLFSQVAGRTT
mgnify:FL=1